MPFKLIPPGERKANPWYVVRLTVAGKRREFSSKTRDPEAARRFALGLELVLLDSRVPGPHEKITFERVAALWKAFKNPAKADVRSLDKVTALLGKRAVDELQHADLVAMANELYPRGAAAYKNRHALKPAGSVLHYAARNKWCPWLRIEKFPEEKPPTRAAAADQAKALIAALEREAAAATTEYRRRMARKQRLLLLWLFKHWNRISEPLRLTWEDLELNSRVYRLHVRKTDQRKGKPIDEEVFEALANEPEGEREGWLFPWRTRSGVYKWLRPLCRRLGIRFTPHMARHYGGKELNRRGAGLKTIMGALDHLDPQSSVRYQDADLEIVREAMGRSERVSPPTPAKPKRRRSSA